MQCYHLCSFEALLVASKVFTPARSNASTNNGPADTASCTAASMQLGHTSSKVKYALCCIVLHCNIFCRNSYDMHQTRLSSSSAAATAACASGCCPPSTWNAASALLYATASVRLSGGKLSPRRHSHSPISLSHCLLQQAAAQLWQLLNVITYRVVVQQYEQHPQQAPDPAVCFAMTILCRFPIHFPFAQHKKCCYGQLHNN